MSAPRDPSTMAPGHIVMFAPLPPQPNGIADYTYELLGALRTRVDCTVVVSDLISNARAPSGVEVIRLIDYCARSDAYARLLHVYQLGNNPDHLFMLPVMSARPGLAVVHDPALHHLLDVATVGPGDLAAYSDALEADYGQPGRILGAQFQEFRLRSQRMYFDMPMLRCLLGPQRGVIVHSRFAASKVLAQVPDARITVVPHHYSPPDPNQMRPANEVRRALGIEAHEIVFMSLGFVTRAKMIDAALRALASIRADLPPFRYVIAGELRTEEIDVVQLASSLGLADRIITTGYVDEDAFFSLIGAADIVINLRHPIGGETSGTMIRSLGAGACLVVVERGAFAEIPNGAAVKLRLGPGFDERLAERLLALAGDRPLRQQIGARARQTTVADNAMTVTIDGYCAAITKAAATPARPWRTQAIWEYLPERARSETLADMLDESQGESAASWPLWLRSGALPSSRAPYRVAILGAERPTSATLRRGLDEGVIHAEIDDLILPPAEVADARMVDLLLISTPVEDVPMSPGRMLSGWNRVLAFGGLIILNIIRRTDVAPRTPFESVTEGRVLFEASGFRVQDHTAVAAPLLHIDTSGADETEECCWRVVKVSEFLTADIRAQAAQDTNRSVRASRR